MEILIGSLLISGSVGIFYKTISSNNTTENITEDLTKSINNSDYIFEKEDELCVITPTLTPHSTAPIPHNKINSVIPY
jgi:hypothetical protein